jgi:hypothetical protein
MLSNYYLIIENMIFLLFLLSITAEATFFKDEHTIPFEHDTHLQVVTYKHVGLFDPAIPTSQLTFYISVVYNLSVTPSAIHLKCGVTESDAVFNHRDSEQWLVRRVRQVSPEDFTDEGRIFFRPPSISVDYNLLPEEKL